MNWEMFPLEVRFDKPGRYDEKKKKLNLHFEHSVLAVKVARPPVPFRKIVSTHLPDGEEVSVNAQQYVVLVSDVPPPRWVPIILAANASLKSE